METIYSFGEWLKRRRKGLDLTQRQLAKPFAAASRWFADMFASLIPHSPPAGLMPPEERWAAIEQLYDSLQ
jgi:hypothetical protein